MEKNKNSGLKTTKKERRKKFNKWIDLNFLHKQKGDSIPFHGMGDGKPAFCDICGERISVGKYKNGIWTCDHCENRVCAICGKRTRLYLVHPDKDCKEYWCDECIRDEEEMMKKGD